MKNLDKEIQKLYLSANEIREDVVDMLKYAGSGHLGGSFSEAEILSVLFNNELKLDPSNPLWENRDRFILSKGHACPGLYSILAQKKFFPKTEFKNLRQINGLLQGHPERITPGVEHIAGFLGQGLSAGCGMALGFKRNKKTNRVYVLIGDGDNLEGQTWEAARFASHHKLDNLVAIFDHNNILSDTNTDQVLSIKNPEKQWASFGWNVIIIDGHNIFEILKSVEISKNNKNSPTIIIANTKKGHGVSIWEDSGKSHGSWGPSDKEYEIAKKELEISKKKILNDKYLKSTKIDILKPMIEIEKNVSNNEQCQDFDEYRFEVGQEISLRNAFGMATSNLAKKYQNFDLFDADVKGGTMTSIFEQHFPNRFIQCGIAEQNMTSAAVGYYLATDRIPIITTYAVFTSMLTAAQFRNGIAMQKLPIIVVSSHVGVDTGPDGPTHQAIEDMAIFSSYPGVQVLSPCDANRVQAVFESALISKKPTYMRTGRSPVPVIYPSNIKYEIGKDSVLIVGSDISIFATGIMVHRALKAEKKLSEIGIKSEVIDITSINPLDSETILRSVKKTNCAITAEDHYIKNGLSAAINQLVSNEYPVKIKNIGIERYAESGSPEQLAKKYNIFETDIISAAKELVKIK